MSDPTFRRVGEETLLVEFENKIALDVSEQVQRLSGLLMDEQVAGIYECIPSFRSLAIDYNPLTVSHEHIETICRQLLQGDPSAHRQRSRHHAVVPVQYGGEWGPDLDEIAATLQLTPEELVKIHSSLVYTVYMVGFSNGFAYMGDTHELLDLPRRSAPRVVVPVGSIAVAKKQTGIYQLSSPGGWHLLGRTPIPMFDPARERPAFLEAGDRVTFKPINPEEYEEIEQKVQAGISLWDELKSQELK